MPAPLVNPGRGFRSGVVAMLSCAAFLCACGGGVRDIWTGTGEFHEARFYALDLNLAEKAPFAMVKWRDGGELLLAVCALSEEDGRLTFKMDVDAQAASCDRMVRPLLFVGEFGRDVLTGTVQDAAGTPVGPFRAFRVRR